jgi:hypothetical protein
MSCSKRTSRTSPQLLGRGKWLNLCNHYYAFKVIKTDVEHARTAGPNQNMLERRRSKPNFLADTVRLKNGVRKLDNNFRICGLFLCSISKRNTYLRLVDTEAMPSGFEGRRKTVKSIQSSTQYVQGTWVDVRAVDLCSLAIDGNATKSYNARAFQKNTRKRSQISRSS